MNDAYDNARDDKESLFRVLLSIDRIEGQCPVMGYGTLAGHSFEFRARGDWWRFDTTDWAMTQKYDYASTGVDAGWMSHEEAREFIFLAARAWLAERGAK